MATRDYSVLKTEYIIGQMSLRELAELRDVPPGTLLRVADEEHWVEEREAYRVKMSQQALAEAEKRELTARIMAGEATALSFEDFKSMTPKERGARFPELLKQYAAMTGETTERSAIDATLRDWTAGKTPEQIEAIKRAAKMASEQKENDL